MYFVGSSFSDPDHTEVEWNAVRQTIISSVSLSMLGFTTTLSAGGHLAANDTIHAGVTARPSLTDHLLVTADEFGLSEDATIRWSSSSLITGITTASTGGRSKPWPALKQPMYAVVLLAAAYLIVAVVGVVSNGLVIIVIYRNARMRTVTNYFLANLATADILVCIFVLPITLLQNIFTGMPDHYCHSAFQSICRRRNSSPTGCIVVFVLVIVDIIVVAIKRIVATA
jgi:7 transmembrane receptor (rhodopsin family)